MKMRKKKKSKIAIWYFLESIVNFAISEQLFKKLSSLPNHSAGG